MELCNHSSKKRNEKNDVLQVEDCGRDNQEVQTAEGCLVNNQGKCKSSKGHLCGRTWKTHSGETNNVQDKQAAQAVPPSPPAAVYILILIHDTNAQLINMWPFQCLTNGNKNAHMNCN